MAGADNSQQVDTQTRRAFILELRRSGATYRQIAEATIKKFGADNLPLGFDCRYASMDVKRELEKLQAINESQADDLLGKLDRGDAPCAQEGGVGNAVQLVADGFVDLLSSVAVDIDPQRADSVEVTVPLHVDHVGPVTLGHDHAGLLVPFLHLREGVPHVFVVDGNQSLHLFG